MGLSSAEEQALRDLPLTIRSVPGDQEIVRDGFRAQHCCLLLDGLMHRNKYLGNGTRQILSFHVPDDIPDLQSLHLPVSDHNLSTLTPCTIALIPHEPLLRASREFPGLAAALWRDTLIDSAIFRQWITNVGGRSGIQRVAHLMCELVYKLSRVGLANKDGCDLPITQLTIGEATGLSAVHVNRILKDLRDRDLVIARSRVLFIPSWERLASFADFDPAYLGADHTSPSSPDLSFDS